MLGNASPVEIHEHVLQRLDIFAPGGGFIFNTIHNIPPEVPPENIVAVFDAVKEYNK
jgi:uroporphyrinogen decarboxylase